MTPEAFKELEDRLWQTADNLRANSPLKSSEYSVPVLGLIFLKFADNKYSQYEAQIQAEYERLKGTRREKEIHEIALEICGFYLPQEARYSYLLSLPEEADIAQALKNAMQQIEKYKPELEGILPQDEYFKLVPKNNPQMPKDLLKNFSNIPQDASGDMFGKIYEYFLGKFALSEGQGGGEFFTPNSVVRLMVEIIEPHDGTVFDPACGSGGMFVQSAQFIDRRTSTGSVPYRKEDLYVYGQEKTLETVNLAKMNLAVNGLRGEVKQANSYYEDIYDSFGRFDYVMANPPFNVDDVTLSKVENQRRFSEYGIPRNKGKSSSKGEETCPNANYLWINLFATSLKPNGRAALVMANSASDARHSEAEIRQNLIENNLIYAMLTLPSNMFYTVTLPATLWFFDKGKSDKWILFIDARNIFTQIDRAHREFSEPQVQNIALISKLHRGQRQEFVSLIDRYFEQGLERLSENTPKMESVSAQLEAYLRRQNESQIPHLQGVLAQFSRLQKQVIDYRERLDLSDVDAANSRQRELAATFTPFFMGLHDQLKAFDRLVRHYEKISGNARDTKVLKADLDELHREVKVAEEFFGHINWLQERFPQARYEDVTGLCKLATLGEVKEQDYSLNPGRYVGVVIEEDGKTEEEFIDELLEMNQELEKLNTEARVLEDVIGKNLRALLGDA
ncbi:MAG: SAM-dependent DNA methyltransferase [Candidatus Sericytochromatia bacterium]|nr:SAM-dependent DNA methyltransferase [Candidatus Sericytochromatia bacterium]